MVSFLESLVQEILVRYGERALYVLKAAIEVMEEYSALGKKGPGDFDNKGLMKKLREWGITYNPNQLLRIMERDYGIIETTYKSATQRWWKFVDISAVKKAVRYFEGDEESFIEDPEDYVLSLQISVLELDRLLNEVRNIYSKSKLSTMEKERVKKIVIEELPVIAKVMKEAQKYEGKYGDFIKKCAFLMKLVSELLIKMKVGELQNPSLILEKESNPAEEVDHE